MNRIGWGFVAVVVLLAAIFGVLVAQAPMDDIAVRAPPRSIERATPTVVPPPLYPPQLVMPIAGVSGGSLRQDWGDPREGGARAHQGLDFPAPRGTPVRAVFAGRIEKIWQSERGGSTLYLRSTNDDWIAYYAHLDGYAPGVVEGAVVAARAPLGFVGDSGNAGPGNTHLHFGLSRMRPGEAWHAGIPIDPYPLLAPLGPSG